MADRLSNSKLVGNRMMLAGALAHNAGLRPLRAAVTANEAKKNFMPMIAVLKESIV